jgi:hypothetical protein
VLQQEVARWKGSSVHGHYYLTRVSRDSRSVSTACQVRSRRTSRPIVQAFVCDNRHGLVVNAQVTQADGTAERDAAAEMLADAARFAGTSITVGAGKT